MTTYRSACVHVLATVLLLCLCRSTLALEPLDADALANQLENLIDNHPTAKRTTVTLKVVDLQTGEVLYDRGGGKLLIPASNLKIYTAAAALDLLGPEYVWTTGISLAGRIKDGTCQGELLVGGTGDPMLDTPQLVMLADKLVDEHGIKRVHGRIAVTHPPRWSRVPIKGPGWMWDDDPDYYNMSIRSVMLNFNTLTVSVSHGQAGPVVVVDPPTQWPPVVIVPTETGQEGVTISRNPFEESITVAGNPPPGSDSIQETITMHDPDLWIASVFEQMLAERGVDLQDDPEQYADQARVRFYTRLLITQHGKTLAEAIKYFLRVSENAVGEMVLLKLAETQTEGDVSWPAGAKVISDWLTTTAGLEEGSFRIVDGSGLSRYNLISADSSVKLLAFMKSHEHFDVFYDGLNGYQVALPEKEMWGGVPLAEFDPERVHAKSGGMTGVATLSGYVQTLDGRSLAFSFLANGYVGSNQPVFELRNAVLSELVRYQPSEVGAEAVEPVTP